MNIPNPKIVLAKISETNGSASFSMYTRDSSENQKVMGMNSISKFGLAPDETLTMLSKVCNYRLTDEQASIAKLSAMELLSSATSDEITILELVNLWQDTSALADFADSLRKYLLPG
jgi:hypothetical protein